MRSICPPLTRRSRWSWLLALALLLPLAQATATWHGYSHRLKSTADDSQAAQLDHCERCLAAAALSAGALPSLPHSLPVSMAHHAQPPLAAIGLWSARAALAYRSRAPPSIPR